MCCGYKQQHHRRVLASFFLSPSLSLSPQMLSSTGGEKTNLMRRGSSRGGGVSSSSSKSSSSASSSPFSPLPTPRTGKTMEEVWKDINLASLHDHPSRPDDLSVSDHLPCPHTHPHANFRGMILQDFLARPFNNKDPHPSSSSDAAAAAAAATRLYSSIPSAPAPATALSLNSGPDFHFLDTTATRGHSHLVQPHHHHHHHNPIPFPTPFDALASSAGLNSFGKKRFSESDNNSCDRRHKRMIKNRESAARSRARKQAYTNELELEVAHLMEENARLKRQQEELSSATAAQFPKKNTLHRTSTAPF